MNNLIVGATQNATQLDLSLDPSAPISDVMEFYEKCFLHILGFSRGEINNTIIINDEYTFKTLKDICIKVKMCEDDDSVKWYIDNLYEAAVYCTPQQYGCNVEDVAMGLFNGFFKSPIIFARDGEVSNLVAHSIFVKDALSKEDLRDLLPVVPNAICVVEVMFDIESKGIHFSDEFKVSASHFISSYKIKDIAKDIVENTKHTYIMTDASGYYKIGQSYDVEKRFKSLRTGNPTLKIIYISEDNIESYIHRKIQPFKIIGEWFDLSKPLLEEVVKGCAFNKYQDGGISKGS